MGEGFQLQRKWTYFDRIYRRRDDINHAGILAVLNVWIFLQIVFALFKAEVVHCFRSSAQIW